MHNCKKRKWLFKFFCAYFNVFFICCKKQVPGENVLSGKTKIFVVHMKELIYTAIFILLGIVLLLLLVSMFSPEDSKAPTPKPQTKQETLYKASLVHCINH